MRVCVCVFFLKDSEDEMSSDSLNLASDEDDSSGEEAQMQESLRREKSAEKEDSAAMSQLKYVFVPAETDLQRNKPEQQSEPLMVTYFHIPKGFVILLKC